LTSSLSTQPYRSHAPLHSFPTRRSSDLVRFDYPEDHHDFAHAALRCVGVGKCRIPAGEQVMCPSFQVTREEMHTTRGRTRLLFRSEEHTSELQSPYDIVCRLLLEKKKKR